MQNLNEHNITDEVVRRFTARAEPAFAGNYDQPHQAPARVCTRGAPYRG